VVYSRIIESFARIYNIMTKNLGGCPEKVLTDKQIIQVEALAAYLTCEQIADYFGISHVTFQAIRARQEPVSFAYKKGRVGTTVDIASSLISQARQGDTASQIFYLKTRAGWSEKQVIETKDITTSNNLPQINIHVNEKPKHRSEN